MGKALSIASKPIREFNIESRAHKVISKEKPSPAPKFKADEDTRQRLLKEQPESFQKLLRKDEKLDERLKNIFVTSRDPQVNDQSQGATSSDRPLPALRTFSDIGDFGFHEPSNVPYGRVTLRNTLKFLTDHHQDKKIFTIEKIAQDYSLPVDTVEKIVKYFRMYELYVPKHRKLKATFAGPVMPRIKIVERKPELLGETGKKERDKGQFEE